MSCPMSAGYFVTEPFTSLKTPYFTLKSPPPLTFGTNNNRSAKGDAFWYVRKFHSFPNIRALLLGRGGVVTQKPLKGGIDKRIAQTAPHLSFNLSYEQNL